MKQVNRHKRILTVGWDSNVSTNAVLRAHPGELASNKSAMASLPQTALAWCYIATTKRKYQKTMTAVRRA